jgi:hypothetical protein
MNKEVRDGNRKETAQQGLLLFQGGSSCTSSGKPVSSSEASVVGCGMRAKRNEKGFFSSLQRLFMAL